LSDRCLDISLCFLRLRFIDRRRRVQRAAGAVSVVSGPLSVVLKAWSMGQRVRGQMTDYRGKLLDVGGWRQKEDDFEFRNANCGLKKGERQTAQGFTWGI